MDTEDLDALVDELSNNVDDLEESLAPLLKTGYSQSTSKLPLLDKAKAYVFTTYAIESILISYLRLNGVDGKSHAVFQEIARVKEYNAKIRAAETGGAKRNTTLDREAANRIIKHGLAGNDRYDHERAQRVAAEKAGAKRKLEDMAVGTHTRFDGAARRMKVSEGPQEVVKVVKASEAGTSDEEAAASSNRAFRKARKRERQKDGMLAQSQQSDETNQAGQEAINKVHAALPTGKGSMTNSTSVAPTGGNEGTPSKKKKSRRKKLTEKLQNGRAEEMM